MAGFLINSRGTTLMIDPLLEGFDMPLLIEMPIDAAAVPRLDAVLVTHSDNDHYSVPTCRALVGVTGVYHSTGYVASLMTGQGLPGHGHGIGEAFTVGPVRVELTPADHAWQNFSPKHNTRTFQPEDACGFWIDHLGRNDLGARGLPADPRAPPGHARPRRPAVRLLRQRLALHPGRRGPDGQHIPQHPAAAAPLGIRRRPRLLPLQRRPGRPATT